MIVSRQPSLRSAPQRRAEGFTLLEVLLAVSLLAAALALAFGILRAAGATVERGELIAALLESIKPFIVGFALSLIVGVPASETRARVCPDSSKETAHCARCRSFCS